MDGILGQSPLLNIAISQLMFIGSEYVVESIQSVMNYRSFSKPSNCNFIYAQIIVSYDFRPNAQAPVEAGVGIPMLFPANASTTLVAINGDSSINTTFFKILKVTVNGVSSSFSSITSAYISSKTNYYFPGIQFYYFA